MEKHFHFYVTANDDKSYLHDIYNISQLAKMHPGVDQVILKIAVSKVRPISWLDQLFVRKIKRIIKRSSFMQLESIGFKDNIGRDFSSYAYLYRNTVLSNSDYLFFQNRSAYGPLCENWYAKYIAQFTKFCGVAICGTTINFADHCDRSSDINLPHIQTYAFLTQSQVIERFRANFPGEHEADRLAVITNGEIELSQKLLADGYKITCLEWPNFAIGSSDIETFDGPRYDCIETAHEGHPFLHRRWMNIHNRAIVRTKYIRLEYKFHRIIDVILSRGRQ